MGCGHTITSNLVFFALSFSFNVFLKCFLQTAAAAIAQQLTQQLQVQKHQAAQQQQQNPNHPMHHHLQSPQLHPHLLQSPQGHGGHGGHGGGGHSNNMNNNNNGSGSNNNSILQTPRNSISPAPSTPPQTVVQTLINPSTPRLMIEPAVDETTDLEELEQFAKTFKQRRIKLGN